MVFVSALLVWNGVKMISVDENKAMGIATNSYIAQKVIDIRRRYRDTVQSYLKGEIDYDRLEKSKLSMFDELIGYTGAMR